MRWGFWEIILIVVLVVILFGSAKIPSMMKNIADGVKVFKKEIKEKSAKPVKKNTKKAVAKKAK
jgi:sec-independent protein translocase protein TatA